MCDLMVMGFSGNSGEREGEGEEGEPAVYPYEAVLLPHLASKGRVLPKKRQTMQTLGSFLSFASK